MIKQTFDLNDKINFLSENHYSYRIISHLEAYGTSYDFCRFFEIILNDKAQAIICVFNSSMIISTYKKYELSDEFINDIVTFINMNSPESIELDTTISYGLIPFINENYISQKRVYFQFKGKNCLSNIAIDQRPSLDRIYDILSESFDGIKNNYQLWMTDTSHRIRRYKSRIYLYKNSTTATVQYIVKNNAFIGQVATTFEDRGKHYARQLLFYISEILLKQGIKAYLFARENRISYYEEIGFKPIMTDIIIERININE